MKILWIAFVWPEPTSSAAGVRTMQLIKACKEIGYEIEVCSPCQPNVYQRNLENLGIKTIRFEPNDSAFDTYVSDYQPQIVFFDRFMVEEQFSWRVKEQCPDAIRILDTIDLHSLRRSRQRAAVQVKTSITPLLHSEDPCDDALREISSIYRCDLSLITSRSEMELLTDRYRISNNLIRYCPIYYERATSTPRYNGRSNLVVIGNFNHPPNVESFQLLHDVLWKKIRVVLEKRGVSSPELHLFGAYPTEHFLKLDDPATGFRVKGWTPDVKLTLQQYRINLAPLRFGAGIKGKIADGWSAGTPCIATSIAAEGMYGPLPFGGAIEDDWEIFSERVAALYCDQRQWEEAQIHGFQILDHLFKKEIVIEEFLSAVIESHNCRLQKRRENFIGAMLWHHSNRSTEYFSRWIEAKNKLPR